MGEIGSRTKKLQAKYELEGWKTSPPSVYRVKKLTKAQLIRLILKQQAQKPSDSVHKPIPPPRTGKWESVKPKPVPQKNIKQMVNDYEDIIQPPEWIQANSSSSDQN